MQTQSFVQTCNRPNSPASGGGGGGGGGRGASLKHQAVQQHSHRQEEGKKPFKTLLLTLLVSAY